MKYHKQVTRKGIVKRVAALCAIALVIGAILGAGVVSLGCNVSKKKNTEFVVYGVYDDRNFTEEVSLDWEDDGSFVKLNCELDEEVQQYVFYLCKAYNLDYTLIMALIKQESNFKANEISITNDYGLMQINACNHNQLTEILGVTDFLDPYQNVRAGIYTIRKLFEKYQKPELVLMAYNMGEHGASVLWKQGVYKTEYTEKIIKYQGQFNQEIRNK